MQNNPIKILLICALLLVPLTSHAKKDPIMTVDGKPALKDLFVKIENCSPVLSWKEFRKDPANETYDV